MTALKDAILDILAPGVPLKAKDIAAQLATRGYKGIDRSQVNSVLFGEIRGQVRQDRQYRWSLVERTQSSQVQATPGGPSTAPCTLLGRLCGYYIDCLYADGMGDLSVFAQSHTSPDYVEIGSRQELTEDGTAGADLLAEIAGVADLLAAQRRDRNRTTLYYGYPVFLRWIKSKRSNWQGAKIEPLIVCRLENSTEGGRGGWSLADDWPQINTRALQECVGSREELRQLLEDLGLLEAEGEMPTFGDIALRLADLLPELPWREPIEPSSCQDTPPLSGITEPGFYNRGIIMLGGRSQYTAGLEAELAKLAQLPADSIQGTALGHVLVEHESQVLEATSKRRLFEAIPLNDEQRAAVQAAMAAPLTVITGPPGTGKSQVVTSILVNAALDGQRVLFASKNNKAVDVVLERANGLTSRPILVRLGAEDAHRDRLLSFLADLLSTTATPSDERALAEATADYQSLLAKRGETEKEFQNVVALRNRVDQLERQVEPPRNEWPAQVFRSCLIGNNPFSLTAATELRDSAEDCVRTISGFCGYIRWLLFRKGMLRRLNNALSQCCPDAERLGLALPPNADKTSRLSVYRTAAQSLLNQVQIGNLVAEYGKALQQLRSVPSIPVLSLRDAELSDRLADTATDYLAAWSRCIPSRLDQQSRRALSQYRAALQSLTGAGLSKQQVARLFREIEASFQTISKFLSCWCVTNLAARGRVPFVGHFFDLLVIDEASQCDIASAMPLLFRAKRAVIIGDPKQLQHIATLSKSQDAEFRRKHDLLGFDTLDFSYKENSLFALALGFVGKDAVIKLRDHHRSHADIVSFSNRHFYEGDLRIATDYRKLKRDGQNCGIRWINVKGPVIKPGGHGALNADEAKRVAAEVVSLIRNRKYTGSVGVTTPFRAQANRIRDILQKEMSAAEVSAADLLVEVVHKFQGDERDCMFFSPVVSDSMPETALGFLRSTGNLFNVAITRARAILFVVGDMEQCRCCGIDYLAKFAEHCSCATHDEENEEWGGPFESPWEKVLYDALVQDGMKPMPQYVINQYRLDLAIKTPRVRLDVEVDGERYHRDWTGDICRSDVIRNQRLSEQGWSVLRFWVYEIRDDLPDCVRRVREALGRTA
jgi:very-short-patch-repair endonuclease/polyhydroxyalkanoate synthesis regulator phasin